MRLALLVALGVTGFHGRRTYRRAVYWQRHHNEPLRPWMNLAYVTHSYNVPRAALDQALGLGPGNRLRRRPLGYIARAQHRKTAEVISEVEKAIAIPGRLVRGSHASGHESVNQLS